jgi:hypothetical protein
VKSMADIKQEARHHTHGEPSTLAAVVSAMALCNGDSINSAHSASSSGDRDITLIWALAKDEL